MRKVVFKINDIQYFQESMLLTEAETKKHFSERDAFDVSFTLYGRDHTPLFYELSNSRGERIDPDSVTSYQLIILNDCFKYFLSANGASVKPFGVVSITEE